MGESAFDQWITTPPDPEHPDRDEVQCPECKRYQYEDVHLANCEWCGALMPGFCPGCGCCHCDPEVNCEGHHNCMEAGCACTKHLEETNP